MKSLIAYYSHTGNTAYVADRFSEAFQAKGQTKIFEIKYAGHKPNIFTRAFYSMFPSLVKLDELPIDLLQYDLLFVGIPVIISRPPAAVVKYLQLCRHMANKRIICCYVYGLESSARRCAKTVESILRHKGSQKPVHIFLPYQDVYKKEILNKFITDAYNTLFI